jgi:hypothetical protein
LDGAFNGSCSDQIGAEIAIPNPAPENQYFVALNAKLEPILCDFLVFFACNITNLLAAVYRSSVPT